eukprot:GHVL01015456.1.p1 GENE.GHVL01015456.1~~GHVL01015456.1.p1  ORF type:complete len:1158 (-),score=319.71 GHVL01015456.1:110-3583(-)
MSKKTASAVVSAVTGKLKPKNVSVDLMKPSPIETLPKSYILSDNRTSVQAVNTLFRYYETVTKDDTNLETRTVITSNVLEQWINLNNNNEYELNDLMKNKIQEDNNHVIVVRNFIHNITQTIYAINYNKNNIFNKVYNIDPNAIIRLLDNIQKLLDNDNRVIKLALKYNRDNICTSAHILKNLYLKNIDNKIQDETWDSIYKLFKTGSPPGGHMYTVDKWKNTEIPDTFHYVNEQKDLVNHLLPEFNKLLENEIESTSSRYDENFIKSIKCLIYALNIGYPKENGKIRKILIKQEIGNTNPIRESDRMSVTYNELKRLDDLYPQVIRKLYLSAKSDLKAVETMLEGLSELTTTDSLLLTSISRKILKNIFSNPRINLKTTLNSIQCLFQIPSSFSDDLFETIINRTCNMTIPPEDRITVFLKFSKLFQLWQLQDKTSDTLKSVDIEQKANNLINRFTLNICEDTEKRFISDVSVPTMVDMFVNYSNLVTNGYLKDTTIQTLITIFDEKFDFSNLNTEEMILTGRALVEMTSIESLANDQNFFQNIIFNYYKNFCINIVKIKDDPCLYYKDDKFIKFLSLFVQFQTYIENDIIKNDILYSNLTDVQMVLSEYISVNPFKDFSTKALAWTAVLSRKLILKTKVVFPVLEKEISSKLSIFPTIDLISVIDTFSKVDHPTDDFFELAIQTLTDTSVMDHSKNCFLKDILILCEAFNSLSDDRIDNFIVSRVKELDVELVDFRFLLTVTKYQVNKKSKIIIDLLETLLLDPKIIDNFKLWELCLLYCDISKIVDNNIKNDIYNKIDNKLKLISQKDMIKLMTAVSKSIVTDHTKYLLTTFSNQLTDNINSGIKLMNFDYNDYSEILWCFVTAQITPKSFVTAVGDDILKRSIISQLSLTNVSQVGFFFARANINDIDDINIYKDIQKKIVKRLWTISVEDRKQAVNKLSSKQSYETDDTKRTNGTSARDNHFRKNPKFIERGTDWIVIEKPAGWKVLASDETRDGDAIPGTLQNQIQKMLTNDVEEGKREFPAIWSSKTDYGICHRLDKDTTGALLIATTPQSWYFYRCLFNARMIEKEYDCLCHGMIPVGCEIVENRLTPIVTKRTSYTVVDDRNGSPAVTVVNCLKNYKDLDGDIYSYCRIRLLSGRKHQIRVHLKHIGN